MTIPHHLLVNGLSIGSGGGYTVGRELTRHLALERPTWNLTLVLAAGNPLHEQMKGEPWPDNCRLHWAPQSASGRLARSRYEAGELVAWAERNRVTRVLQLNGMVIPALRLPTLAHNQDPWPYRREAWDGWRDRIVAYLKRREHARALRTADCAGFTSAYLRDLICGHHGIRPRRAEVFYNGLPDSWLQRARGVLPDWQSRPMELVTVSNVGPYKRQYLVVQALPRLVRRPGLESITYRIVGDCAPEQREKLLELARGLRVERHVVLEGRVSDEKVREFLSRARCFVLMSVCESFGIPAVEAMTFGTPVVTSNCCAMPEVCGAAAQLCPVDDVEALADRIAAVMTTPALAEEMRRNGAEQAQRFGWQPTAARMAAALEEMHDRAGAPQPRAAAAPVTR